MKFLNHADLQKNQILNVVLHNATAHPATPKAGQFYYNTTDKVIWYFDGTIWKSIGMVVEAGEGLTHVDLGNVRTLNLNVDNATLEINNDIVRIKDLGVTTAKIANDAVTTIKILDKNITFAKIQDMVAMRVIGSIAGGTPMQIPILDEIDLISNSGTSLATQSSIKAYVDATVAGIGTLVGGFDASAGGNLPGSGTTKKGSYWHVTVAGTVQGQVFNVGDVIIANQNAPTTTNPNHYVFLETNRDQATTTVLGMLRLATAAEVITGTDALKAITPATLVARTATETRTGLAAIATQAEVTTGTDDTKFITPLKLKAHLNAKTGIATADIGNGAALSFAVSHTLATKDLQIEVYDNTTGEKVYPNIARANATPFDVTISFGSDSVPGANAYRVVIFKVS